MKPELTIEEWRAIAPHVEDCSEQLPDAFLMIFQWMRALVKYKGRLYYVVGWTVPNGKAYVTCEGR